MSMKVSGDSPKALLKRALRPWLPQSTIDRPKMGFMIPMDRWLGQSLAADVLLDPRTLDRGLFRAERLEALVAEHRDGTGDHGYRIWTLVMLELWFRTYIDRSAVQAPLELSVA
jgi:asparagine synthase (glutamine-hydrolysing)